MQWLENCQHLQNNKIIRRAIVSIWVILSLPTLSWRKTSRVANPHLHLPWSKSTQVQRSSTDLSQTPPPPQDPCTPSPPQDPCTLCYCSPLYNYESLPFSATGSYYGIVKSANRKAEKKKCREKKRARTFITKVNVITCHLSQCHWVKRAQLTDVSSLPPTPSAPTLYPVCTPPLQPSRKPDNLHFCCNYLLSQLNKEIFTKSDTMTGIQQYQEQLHCKC